MSAEKGEEAAEKGATTAAMKEQMGVEAADVEKGARAVEKVVTGVKAADEKGATAAEKAATAVENGEEKSTAADEGEGATEEGKGKKREAGAVGKEPTTHWELEWKWKGATAADAEEGSQPRRERRRWRSTRRDRGVAVEKEEEEDTAAATEGAGEKAVFFFSATAAGKMINLVSSEGQLFRMSESAARLSLVLADMIDNGCASGNIPLPNVDDTALATVIKYCNTHATAESDSNRGAADEGGGGNTAASKKALDEWDRKLFEHLTQDALFDLITAADFLDIKGLLQASCQKVADMIANKIPEQVRTMFNIDNDFTPEEEEEIREETPWVFEDEEASDDEEV